MSIFARKGLETRFVATVGIGLLLFSLIAGIFTYAYSYVNQLDAARSLQQQLVYTVQAQAEVAAFASNTEIAHGVLEGLLANPIILAVRIEAAPRFKVELGSRKNVDFGAGKSYPLFSPVDHIERIGALVVVQNDDQINSAAAHAAVFQTLLMLAQMITGAIIMASVLRALMINPISRLAQEIAAIQPGSSTRLQIEDKHLANEIGLLSKSANALLEAAESAINVLKHQNGLFSALLKNLPVGVFMVEAPSGKPLMANEAAFNLLGPGILPDASRHSMAKVYKAYKVGSLEPYPPEQMPIVLGMSGVTSHVDDVAIERPDGNLTQLEIFGAPVTDENGQVWASLVSFLDITERRRMEQQIHQFAFQDSLTQLPNRRLLNDRLAQTIDAGKQRGCYGALVFIDLDNFKILNDTHGHQVGDLLLIDAAKRLKNCVRDRDTLVRFGGDEFVVMINDLVADKDESIAQASFIAEKIRAALSAPYLLTIREEGRGDTHIEHCCTASIGVTMFFDDDLSPHDILKWADTAMYQAKEAGRNSVRFYGSEP